MNKAFFDAVRTGDSAKVAQMIDADPALLTAVDDNGLGSFTVARYSRQDAIAKLLLDRGVHLDINAAAMAGVTGRVLELLEEDRNCVGVYSHDGWTPLHLASFFGNEACVSILLANGAKPNARSRNAMENTPLHAAAAGRHKDVVERLLKNDADVNAQQKGGWTPLHAAAQNGDVAMARTLLANGAHANVRADNNQTPLDLALTRGHQDMVELLEQHAGELKS